MILHEKRKRPEPWRTQRTALRYSWLVPLLAIEWVFEWIAFALSRWSFLEVLEYLGEADLCSANLSGAVLDGATLDAAELGNADLGKVKWQEIKSLKGANIRQVRNAPEGFIQWATQHGAVTTEWQSDCP
jgi:uncharacterized protein YjbI with pentapeptide repeats